MTSYGFRLFQVKLHRENRNSTTAFVNIEGQTTWTYAQHLGEILGGHVDDVQRGLPHDSEEVSELDSAQERLKPLFTLMDHARKGDHLIFSVRHGRKSGHELAMADPELPDDEDLNIQNHYPARVHRAALLIPEAGEVGVLAVETISRACPQRPIVRWFAHWSKNAAMAAGYAEDGSKKLWWKLTACPLSDEEMRQKFIDRSKVENIRLTRTGKTVDRKRTEEDIQLSSKITTDENKSRIHRFVAEWYRDNQRGRSTDSVEAAKSVAALVGGDVSEIDFDDVDVTLRDAESNQVKTVSPDKFSDIFIYPLGEDAAPSDGELYGGIRTAVARLEDALQTSINWGGWWLPAKG